MTERVTIEGEVVSIADSAFTLSSKNESIAVTIKPNARVLPERTSLREGERAIVSGEAEEEVTGGGFREAAVVKLRGVHASIIACGEDAPRLMAEALLGELPDDFRTASRRSHAIDFIRVLLVLGFLASLFAATQAIFYIEDIGLVFDVLVCAGAAAIQCIVTRHMYGRPLGFATESGSVDKPWKAATVGIIGLGVGVFPAVMITIGDAEQTLYEGQRVYKGQLTACVALALFLALLAAMLLGELRSAKIALALLRAKAHSGTIFHASEKVHGIKLAAASMLEETFNEGSGANTTAYRGCIGSFTLVRDDGERVSVTLDGNSAFGSTYRAHLNTRATGADKKVILSMDVVPDGSPVLVDGEVARVNEVLAMRQPLAMFASKNPPHDLRVRLFAFAAVLFAIALGIITLVYFIVHHPFLPPYHSGPSSD